MKKLTLISIILLLSSSALAQDYTKKWELFGSLGAGKAYDDEGNIGTGIDVGGGVSYRLTPKLALEGQVNRIHHEREFDFSPVRFEGTALFGTANLVYHFRTAQVQPYLFGGAGFVNHEGRVDLPPFPSLGEISATGPAYNFGAGVKIFVKQNLSIRPEFRVFVGHPNDAAIEPPFSIFRGSVAIGYHW